MTPENEEAPVNAEASYKPRLLAYCDSPTCLSGFAQVARNILMLLHETGLFEIEVFGINHYPQCDDFGKLLSEPYPFPIMKANYVTEEEMKMGYNPRDVYGNSKLIKLVTQGKYDVLWSVQDPFVVDFISPKMREMEQKTGIKKPITMLYFPVDSANAELQWLQIPLSFDYPVSYTEFGKNECVRRLTDENERMNNKISVGQLDKAKQMPVIVHGTNVKDFFPIEPSETFDRASIRKELFSHSGEPLKEEPYVVLNLNRNQPRKDIPRTLMVFKEFKKKVPNAVLWLFMKRDDIGWNLDDCLNSFDLIAEKDVFFAPYEKVNPSYGFPLTAVNEAYNLSDVLITTTRGEGWGLSITEAMACKLPVVAPNNSSIPEVIGSGAEQRGWLAACGTTTSEWDIPYGDVRDPLRPLTNVDDMVSKMMEVYSNPEERKRRVEAAYKWVQENTWEVIFKRDWLPLFKKVAEQVSKE